MAWRFPIAGDVLARCVKEEGGIGATGERMRRITSDQPSRARAEKVFGPAARRGQPEVHQRSRSSEWRRWRRKTMRGGAVRNEDLTDPSQYLYLWP
jgi:hypothetical protein